MEEASRLRSSLAPRWPRTRRCSPEGLVGCACPALTIPIVRFEFPITWPRRCYSTTSVALGADLLTLLPMLACLPYPTPPPGHVLHCLRDYDGDGDLDVIMTSVGSKTQLHRNNGGDSFEKVAGNTLVNEVTAYRLAIADFDGDGTHWRI